MARDLRQPYIPSTTIVLGDTFVTCASCLNTPSITYQEKETCFAAVLLELYRRYV